MHYLRTHCVYADTGDCMLFPMNVEVAESPTRLLRREAHTVRIRFDLGVPYFYCGAIMPFVDVFVEILGGFNGATDTDVCLGIVFRARSWSVRGDPLVGHHESVLRQLPAVVGSPVIRKLFTSTVSSLKRLGYPLAHAPPSMQGKFGFITPRGP